MTEAPLTLPLTGVTVLSVEQYGAGPFGSMYMADMGAMVIKIEQPAPENGRGGDSARHSGPHFLGDNDSHFFQTFNRNKRSITLNLKSQDGQRILHRLVNSADILMNNLRGDQPDRLGLTYPSLAPHNPRLVCGHLSGYGRAGERSKWPAYDYLIQAEAGFMELTGEPDAPPTRMGLSIIDYLSGITTAFALTAALLGAMRTGRGRDVDVTLYDVAMHQLTYPATWFLNEGTDVGRRPRSGHPFVVPCERIPTADGHIFVMCVLPKFWAALCEAVGRPELVGDPRFADFRQRYENRDTLTSILDEVFVTRTTDAWMRIFAGTVPAAPVLSLRQALENPFFIDRAGVQPVDHPLHENLKMVASPIRLDGVIPSARPAPALGADTDQVLSDHGYSAAEIAGFRAGGVV